MLVATHTGKVRLHVFIQLTLERRSFRFFTMLNNGSCIVITYWSADSIFVSVVVGYVLRACVAAPECFVLMVNVKKFVAYVAHVAHVAIVAIVIDRKMRIRATFPLPLVESRSIIGSKECSNERDDAFFNILLLPNITLITFITLLTLVSIESVAKRFTQLQILLALRD